MMIIVYNKSGDIQYLLDNKTTTKGMRKGCSGIHYNERIKFS